MGFFSKTTAANTTPPTTGQKIKRYAILSGLVLALLTVTITSYTVMGSYSDGFRVGNVIKLSHKGFVFKTWEGQLDQGYITQDPNGINTRVWNFSVHNSDQNVIQAINEAITHNKKVKLYYKEKFIQLSFLGETKYFIYQVETIQ